MIFFSTLFLTSSIIFLLPKCTYCNIFNSVLWYLQRNASSISGTETFPIHQDLRSQVVCIRMDPSVVLVLKATTLDTVILSLHFKRPLQFSQETAQHSWEKKHQDYPTYTACLQDLLFFVLVYFFILLLRSQLRHAGSFMVACKLLVVSCGSFVP